MARLRILTLAALLCGAGCSEEESAEETASEQPPPAAEPSEPEPPFDPPDEVSAPVGEPGTEEERARLEAECYAGSRRACDKLGH